MTGHLFVLPAGRARPAGGRPADRTRRRAVFDAARRVADIVIVATGPMGTPRSQALVMVTDVTVVEAVESQSRLGDLVAIAEDPMSVGQSRRGLRRPGAVASATSNCRDMTEVGREVGETPGGT